MARNRKQSKENKKKAKFEKLLAKQNFHNKKDLTPYIAVSHIKNGGNLEDHIIL